MKKKLEADERLQKFLNKSNHEFQTELETIRRNTQLSIAEYTKQVDMAIAKDNHTFQTWLFEEQKKVQLELAEYNRETHLQIAEQQRKNALEKIDSEIILRDWPLTLQPSEIINSYVKGKSAPLRVIIIPPKIDNDNLDSTQQFLSKHEKRLAQGIRCFIEKHYSLHGDTPVEFLGGAWKSNKIKQEAAIKRVFNALASEPTLILDFEVDEEMFNLRVAYWSGGQEIYHYQTIISIPYRQYLNKWMTERTGEQLGKYAPEDFEKFTQFMNGCQCLLVGFFTDLHYQVFHNSPPKLLGYLAEIYDIFPDMETRNLMLNCFIDSYEEIFTALEIDRDYLIPDFRLRLAQGLATLPDKSLGKKQFVEAMRSWLKLRTMEVSESEAIANLLDSIFELANSLEDNEYLFKLKEVQQQIQAI